MDETIGAKGGHNDQRRTMIITRENKKKLEEYEEQREIEELEKKVKKQQIYTLVKTLPIVIGGEVVKTLHDTANGKREDKEEERSKWRIKEYNGDVSPVSIQEEAEQKRKKIIVTPTGQKIVVVIENPEVVKDDFQEPVKEHYDQPVVDVQPTTPHIVPVTIPSLKEFFVPHTAPVEETSNEKSKEEVSVTPVQPKKGVGSTPIEEIDVEKFIEYELPNVDFSELSPAALEKLDKLKSRKIVEEYERQLKDIRYELRKVIYEYNVLVEDNDEVVLSKDAEIILDRLSEIIDRVEELKRRIRIEDLDKYDDNYIYYLIEGYLREFKDKKLIDEVKDSPLYVLLSEKLDELEKKRDKFQVEVEDKKEHLEDKEKDFDLLKNRYYSIERLNEQLLEFQYDQDRVLKEIQEKVRTATTESERVEEEFVGMTRQSRRLLQMLSFQMFLPGPKFARGLAASAAAYLYFMNNIVRPNTVTRRYRVITVRDYSRDIENSISELDDAIHLLGKTSDQIVKMIQDVEYRFQDYLGVIPEADELLRNLNKVKSEVEEKEYEMKRIKQQQELELERNNAKVKTIGEYPVN